ncbi:ArfGap-domain-containing protein [Ephemerocybe angulata]|uniref:ArfGap-domain-containing protein n=1 Tax=Ephemerocybe angulata TaxID=980116 RepID=A0A8H6IDG0_9AGAR|nr:ArfGap-domain-containing protein [Tulosesus angulatus]
MTDQVQARKLLSELSKREDLGNKVCADCQNPNPQWASLSFAIFICLQCAGTHRGFGVHISFVRSISMDTWQEEQLKRMQLGGNSPFKQFVESYSPVDQGGYKADASSYDRYHSWAAAQYRDKLDAMLAGRDWSPSAPPPGFGNPSRMASPGPAAAQGLRKSRASARSAPNRSDSHSPSVRGGSGTGTPNPGLDQKSQNESYFASLGKANESRREDLPPSQGGRYTGFGSTPTPPPNQNPLSSANAPSLSDLQENPVAAISKGWSLFAAAVAGATKAVSENVIQPGVEKVTDPSFQATVRGYMTEAQKKAATVGSTANDWSKNQFGVDVADTVGGAVGAVRERVGGGPSRAGYGHVSLTSPNDFGESSGLYSPDDTDDFFTEFDPQAKSPQHSSLGATTGLSTTQAPGPLNAKNTSSKKADDWDDWKEF